MPRLAHALCLMVASLACAPAHAQSALPRAAHRYELKAKLDDVRRRVEGRVRITFTNTSIRPLDQLVFHLYLNAFRDDESVFMRESGGHARGLAASGSGSITLQRLRIAGHDALDQSTRELIAHDFTQLRAPLAEPLAPGRQVAIEAEFVVKLPPLFVRSGYTPDFFAVAQWFPKLAKLEAGGHFESFPYHALGEFYADFADYTLELDSAADLSVAASGELRAERRSAGRTIRRYRAEHVHDVAFVAARGFREHVEYVQGVRVHYLSPPGYQQALRAHAAVVRAGLRHFGRAFGHYPYPTLAVVLPPRAAQGAAGMEYPTLIVSDGPWRTLPALPSLTGPFVTAHELAHQWFYGLLASNEVRFPVLDEGLAQWAALDLMRATFGAREGFGDRLSFDRFELERMVAAPDAASTAPGLPAYAYTAREYGASVYARAAAALESIRRAHGHTRFARALARYSTHQRFGHPTPSDLEQAFEGAYGAGFSARTLRPLLFEGERSAVHFSDVRTSQEGDHYVTRVSARRTGAVALPTWLALYAEDGRELARVRWPSDSPTLAAAVETREPVARALLDPERALLLDANTADQVIDFAPPSSHGWLARLLAIAQLAIGWFGP